MGSSISTRRTNGEYTSSVLGELPALVAKDGTELEFHAVLSGTRTPDGRLTISLRVHHEKLVWYRSWRDVQHDPSEWTLGQWMSLLVSHLTAVITSSLK